MNPEKQEKESKENKKKENSVSFEDQTDELKRVEENRRITRSMTDIERRDLDREQISTFWLKVENTECFDDISIYTVEVLVKEHKMPEVIEAKEKEIENLEKYGVFEEVQDVGQETVGSRWIITKKEKADGQKQNFKGRLVAKEF